MILRHWLPAVIVIGIMATIISRTWLRHTEPKIMVSANEELLASLNDAVSARAALFDAGGLAETEGLIPRPTERLPAVQDPELFTWQMTRSYDSEGKVLPPFVKERPNNEGNYYLDAWGQAIHNAIIDGKYRAQSAGTDRKFGTADDQFSDNRSSRLSGKSGKTGKKSKSAAKP